jgi:DNA uptake protein ComE-like DNA-binding protein
MAKECSVKANTNGAALIGVTLAILVAISGCQTKKETSGGKVNAAVSNPAPQTSTNSKQSEPAKTEPSAPSTAGSLATPTEAYKAGYNARQKKDLPALKRVLSSDAREFLTEIGKDEHKTLDDQLRELAERPQAATAETRNEKINGNRASLEYLNEKGKWVSMEFVKEGNDWKIDLPKSP